MTKALTLSLVVQLISGSVWLTAGAADQSISNKTLPLQESLNQGFVERLLRKTHLKRTPKAKATESKATEKAAEPKPEVEPTAVAEPVAPAPTATSVVETTPETSTTSVQPKTETTSPGWADAVSDQTSTSAQPAPAAVEPTVTVESKTAGDTKSGDAISTTTTAEPEKPLAGEVRVDSTQPKAALAPLPVETIAPTAVPEISTDGVIVIDNDELVEQEATIAYEDLPTDEGKTRVKVGGRFPVVLTCEINSKTAKKGDTIHGRLKYDLKIGDRLIAQKGSTVLGHVDYALRARTVMGSLITTERFYRNSGCIGIKFDEIVNERNEHIPLVAEPAKQALFVKNKAEGRVLGINHKGQVTGPWSQQLRYKAVRVGLNFALAPAGVFSFGAMPVALGLMGAANPSFAFMKPVGLNVRHRRLKGFAWGFLSGIPGSFLIEDTTVKGQEAVLKPGDEFLAEVRQEFTGEPASEAELMPGASAKVRGEVVGQTGAKKSKKERKK